MNENKKPLIESLLEITVKIIFTPIIILLWLVDNAFTNPVENSNYDFFSQETKPKPKTVSNSPTYLPVRTSFYDKRTGKVYKESIPPYPEDESL